jgi:hypothetical protein
MAYLATNVGLIARQAALAIAAAAIAAATD